MLSLIKEKFGFDRFERKKIAFFEKHGWQFMPFAQKEPLPDPRLLVPHQVGEIQKLLDAIREGDLVSFVVSDIGMGKTTLCKFLAETLPEEEDHPKMITVFLHGPSIETPEQMLRSILARLEIEPKGDLASEFEQLYRWHEMYPDILLVLIVDEFPDIDEKALEVTRALADLRGIIWIFNGQKNKILKFLEQHSPALLQRRRIILELRPMSAEEAEELLALRMAWARGNDFNNLSTEPFVREAIVGIYKRSKGIPREALKLAGDAVYLAVKDGSDKITPQTIKKIIKFPSRRKKIKKLTSRRKKKAKQVVKVKPKRKFLSFLRLRRRQTPVDE
jgi:type II secretory pathway predicted ATPase ExeA